MAKSNNDNLLNSMLYESDAAYIGSKSKNQVVNVVDINSNLFYLCFLQKLKIEFLYI